MIINLEIINLTSYGFSIVLTSVANLRKNLTVCVIQEALTELIFIDKNTLKVPVVLCSSEVLQIVKYIFLLILIIYSVKYIFQV
jgi:hypothetical protein